MAHACAACGASPLTLCSVSALQVVGIFAGFGLLLLVASPFLLPGHPVVLTACAVKVTTTFCLPRERRDAEQDPAAEAGSPTPPRCPLSLNISLALRAPLSFTVSRQDAVIPGLMSCRRPRPPGAVTPGMGGKAGVVGVSHRVSSGDSHQECAVQHPHPGDVSPVSRGPDLHVAATSHAECSLSPPWLSRAGASWLREVSLRIVPTSDRI